MDGDSPVSSQNGHRNMTPESWDLNRNRKNLSLLLSLLKTMKENSVKDTYFEMPHNAQIFAAYTAVMPLSYIVPLSLQEALKFYAILLEST